MPSNNISNELISLSEKEKFELILLNMSSKGERYCDLHIAIICNNISLKYVDREISNKFEYYENSPLKTFEDGFDISKYIYTSLGNYTIKNYDTKSFQQCFFLYKINEVKYDVRCQILPIYIDGFHLLIRITPPI